MKFTLPAMLLCAAFNSQANDLATPDYQSISHLDNHLETLNINAKNFEDVATLTRATTSGVSWDSASCRDLTSNIGGDDMPYYPVILVNSNNECAVGLHGSGSPVIDMYTSVMAEINPQIDLVEHNFKEMITQFVNNAAAQADANVKNVSADLTGIMKMRIDGIVDSQGYVPVTFSNFGIHGIGKLRKYQLGMKIDIYINIKYNNLTMKGKYNVHTGQLIANPDISSYQPEVSTKVKLPFFLRILDAITPEIFYKLQTEFGRVVTDIFEFLGVDMSRDIPQAVQHVANLIPDTVVEIKPLNQYKVGDHAFYEININRRYASLSDGHNTTVMQIVLFRLGY
ncbi:hypothetical protein [Pseudoalteromonas aurantia]|uniref:Uncharacterized protein n=1 Tax=Pseudoalteromonas aurantia 208 TaxID=1314867 RepID=A0ABR9EJM3_9GAMM|nr:hypothetical protein [Pseudoalteromonas aurantia]MBE0370460.1 hypothetical protein [Pseudoalteromonas aurantia 208]